MSESLITTHKLENGLEISFHDQGNRYFGDYHQVKIIISCRVALNNDLLSSHLSADDLQKAIKIFGDHVEYKRVIKQMGVAGADVEQVKTSMVQNFVENAANYMQSADFASRFVARRLTEHRNRSRMHLVGYD
jgi:hypothetical protein